MLYSLNGRVSDKLADRAVIECGGVGYEVLMTRAGLAALPPVGDAAFVYLHMVIREDSVELFGFCDIDERDCFRALLDVSGVGPKAAAAVLSELRPSELALAVATGDSAMITRAQGVGPKAAQRISLELKDRLSVFAAEIPAKQAEQKGDGAKMLEATEALMSLGYTQHEAKRALAEIDVANKSIEDVIRTALKEMR